MEHAIGPVLTFAVGVSLSPFPIIGMVLMLTTARGRANGSAFLVGWVVGLVVAGTATLLLASGADVASGDSSDGVSWVKVVLGIVLLAVAARQWRGRPRAGAEPAMPGWMKTVDHFDGRRAAGLGVALAAINPKNLLLVVGAALAIAQTGVSTGDQAVALAVFVVVATIGPAVPLAIVLFMRDRSQALLADIKEWMVHSNAAIMAVICLLIGAKLIGDGIAG